MLRGANLREVWQSIATASPWLLVSAFSLHFVGFTISAYRWRLLLRTRDSDATIPFLVRSYLVGVFFNNFLPSTIGGDVYRAYDSWKLGQSKSGAAAIVFVDRFLGLLALVLFALLALLSKNALTNKFPGLLVWVSLGAVGMSAVVWAIFMPPAWLIELSGRVKIPLGSKVRAVLDALWSFRGQRNVLLRALALSLLLQANVVIHYFLIAAALDLPVPLGSMFLIVPVATLVTMVPISVNGIGVREGVFVVLLAPFGISSAAALALAWIAYGMVVVLGGLGAVLYATRK